VRLYAAGSDPTLKCHLTATVVATQLDAVKGVIGLIGTSISAFFLIAIALLNIVILRGVWQTFQDVRKCGLEIANIIGSSRLCSRFATASRSLRMIAAGYEIIISGFLS
jgi:nickel/cobalt transporter (NiCoT) family protein